jgi:hypothetical protein
MFQIPTTIRTILLLISSTLTHLPHKSEYLRTDKYRLTITLKKFIYIVRQSEPAPTTPDGWWVLGFTNTMKKVFLALRVSVHTFSLYSCPIANHGD